MRYVSTQEKQKRSIRRVTSEVCFEHSNKHRLERDQATTLHAVHTRFPTRIRRGNMLKYGLFEQRYSAHLLTLYYRKPRHSIQRSIFVPPTFALLVHTLTYEGTDARTQSHPLLEAFFSCGTGSSIFVVAHNRPKFLLRVFLSSPSPHEFSAPHSFFEDRGAK